MKFQITGKNIEITEAMRKATEQKLSRMDKYFVIDESVVARVVARTYRDKQKVEITIFTKMMDFRVEVSASDFYEALDLAIDKLEGQMRKLKTRISKRHHVNLSNSIAFDQFEGEEVSDEDQIVRVKEIELEPIDMEVAITQMEALGHSFYIYHDAEDDLVSVLYKRNDGGYGLIQVKNK